MSNDSNGWEQYSKLVLKELETLGAGIKVLNDSLVDMRNEIAEIKAKEDKVHDLLKWKGRIDEVASPTQLENLRREVEELKTFKTKAVSYFAFIQFLMALAVVVSRFV